jgi:isopropylmalate/homocitrate/citramalate synthase
MPNLPPKALPTDTTLREGVEMAGVHLMKEGYVEVAEKLAEVGIKETDCGYAYKPEHIAPVKAITDAGIDISKRLIIRWIEGKQKKQIDDAVKAGVDVIKVQVGTSRPWKNRLLNPEHYERWKNGKVIPRIVELMNYMDEEYNHIYKQLGLTGTSQADIELLKEVSKAAVDAGADRVSCSESRGCATPPAMQYFAEEIRSVIGGADLQTHCHNDFGMATANTVGWIQGGGTSFDCTINGLGDRAGNASLEECCVVLEVLYGVDTGVKLDKLYDLCSWFEEKTGVKMARTKALTGPGAFLEESEGHIHAKFLKERLGVTDEWFLPISPSVVGQEHYAVWGSSSLGGPAIEAKLENMGLSYTEEDVEKIKKMCWKILDEKAGTGEAWISNPDFEKMVKDLLK